MTAPFTVVGDVLGLLRRPVREFEIVRHHAGALFQLPVEQRLDLVDEAGKQVRH